MVIIDTAPETAWLSGISPIARLADIPDQLACSRCQLDLNPLMPKNWRKPAPVAIATYIY